MVKASILGSLPSGLRKRSEANKAKEPKKLKSEDDVQQLVCSSSDEIIVANHVDVLLGRGKGRYEWRGNVRYQQIIGLYLPSYMAAKKKCEKTQISVDIVEHVKQGGGRFLKETTRGKLSEVPDKEARDKVAQALRFRRKACEKEKGGSESGGFQFGFSRFSCTPAVSVTPSCMSPFTQYREAVSSTRTDDTEPVVSGRSTSTSTIDDRRFSPMPEQSGWSKEEGWQQEADGDWFMEDAYDRTNDSIETQSNPSDQGDSLHMMAKTIPMQFGSEDMLQEADCGSDISSEFSLLDLGSDDGHNY